MKRIGLILMTILLVALPLFSQNGHIVDNNEIQYPNSNDQLFLLETVSFQDSILLDSAFIYLWDEAISDWVYHGFTQVHAKTIYTYDEFGNLILEIPHHWSRETYKWSECEVKGYSYDESGNIILAISLHLDEATNERIVHTKTEYTYDENGNQTLSIQFDRRETTHDWVGNEKIEFGYDENGNIMSIDKYDWSSENNDWVVGSRKYEYAYDANNNMVLEIWYEWDETKNVWWEIWRQKTEYVYDENSNILSIDLYEWRLDINDWVVWERKYEYAYAENGNMILEIRYSWNHSTSIWQESEKSEYLYDENGKKTQRIYYNDGRINEKYEYSYDENEKLIVEIQFHMDEITKNWIASGKTEWYYSNHFQSTQINKYFQNDSLIEIYPNPTNTLLTIEANYADQYSINITSLNGQLIFSTEMEGLSNQIDLSTFQKGVYFITIRSKKSLITKKVVKL